MKLFALQTNHNDIFRNIRKKQFNLHSQQKLIYRDMLRNGVNVDFRKKQYYRVVVNGVPSQYRKLVWASLVSNVYEITQEGYEKIAKDVDQVFVDQQKYKETSQSYEKNGLRSISETNVTEITKDQVSPKKTAGHTFSEERLQKIILAISKLKLDLPRTFPDLPDFHNEPQYYKKLTRLLCVLVAIRSDIGYIQGMSHIAALFLLQTNSEYQSFQAMVTVISRNPLNDFYTFNQQKIRGVCIKIEQRVRKSNSELMQFLIQNGMDMKMLAVNWIMTLFTRCFQVDCLLNIWDIILANDLSEQILIELCAALVIVRKKDLLNCQNGGQMSKILLRGRLDLVDEQWLLESLRKIK